MTDAFSKKMGVCVSIIIPSLNSARYLRKCIESVLCQTLTEIELLCVDAGSTDGTLEVLKEYAGTDSRVRVIHSEKRSYGYQVNLGLTAAQGTYIGIVETDDFIAPSMYERLYTRAGETNWPDFVKGGFVQFADDQGIPCAWPAGREHLGGFFERVLGREEVRKNGILDLNHIWAGIYRRRFLQEKGIALHESPGASYQDLSFSLLTNLLANTAVYIKSEDYWYRIDNVDSSVKSAAKWRCVVDEFRCAAEKLSERGEYTEETRRLIQRAKPGIYVWNAMRLPEKERELFLAAIRPELSECAEAGLTEAEERFLELLRSGTAMEEELSQRQARMEAFWPVAERIRMGGTFVLIGAGNYGERMVLLQKILRRRFIRAAADNNAARYGEEWNDYTLLSVEEAAERYGEEYFVVANRFYCGEIRRQLLDLNVPEERIFTIQDMVFEEEFADLLQQKRTY